MITKIVDVLHNKSGISQRDLIEKDLMLHRILLELDNVKIIKFRSNFGQSAALAAGFEYASGEVMATLDGDLQNDPADIPLLLKKMKDDDLDVVCGWRHKRKDPVSKRAVSKLANWLRGFLIRDPVHDSGCTLRAYKKECFDDLKLMGEMHRYIPSLLLWKGFRIGEVKVNHLPRKYGKTKYSASRIIRGFLDLFDVWFWRKYSSRPLHIFGEMGLMLALFGFLCGAYALYLKYLRGADLSNTFLPVVAVFSVVLGAQFFVSGLLADISVKNYYRSGGGKPYNIQKIVEKK